MLQERAYRYPGENFFSVHPLCKKNLKIYCSSAPQLL